jgi:hypothetical protein
MLRPKTGIACLLAVSCLAASPVLAVPNLISYQGLLNDQNGVPVNGTVSFVFSIYGLSTGGTALWTEAQTTSVTNGVFNVQLGAVTPLPSSVFAQDVLYLGVKAGADPEMTPRQRITASAYSHRAETLTPPIVPIGGIVAWNKSMTGTPALPSGWVECNGQVISDASSPYNGQMVPDLNGVSATPRFLRGSAASGGTGGSEQHVHVVNGMPGRYNDQAQRTPGSPGNTGSASTLPSYYEIVWIIRIR